MKRAIVNIGCIVSGDWRKPFVEGDAILIDGEKLAKVGSVTIATLNDCDLVVDANGVTAGPGFIDSHVHIAFGDYTPRLSGRLPARLPTWRHHHGDLRLRGPRAGRAAHVEGVKALAVAAKQCWDN